MINSSQDLERIYSYLIESEVIHGIEGDEIDNLNKYKRRKGRIERDVLNLRKRVANIQNKIDGKDDELESSEYYRKMGDAEPRSSGKKDQEKNRSYNTGNKQSPKNLKNKLDRAQKKLDKKQKEVKRLAVDIAKTKTPRQK